jgi:hypothetical protein
VAAPGAIFPLAYSPVESGGDTYLGLTCRIATNASDLTRGAEVSGDHSDGDDSGDGVVDVISPVDQGDGSRTYTVRDTVSSSTGPR